MLKVKVPDCSPLTPKLGFSLSGSSSVMHAVLLRMCHNVTVDGVDSAGLISNDTSLFSISFMTGNSFLSTDRPVIQ